MTVGAAVGARRSRTRALRSGDGSLDKAKNAIELENYSSEPVRLNNLELEVRKK